jgi:hypothetical protein
MVASTATSSPTVPGDPAQVEGLSDLVEAFRRIAQTKSPFIVNDLEGGST